MTYGISITTLEDVFLRVGQGEEEKRHFSLVEKEEGKIEEKEIPIGATKDDQYTIAEQSEDKFFTHFWAMVVRKMKMSFRVPAFYIMMVFSTLNLLIYSRSFFQSHFTAEEWQ